MGAVTESGTLLIGTNTYAILTQSIVDWINYGNDDMSYTNAIGYEEESKIESDEDSDYRGHRRFDQDSEFDILEGKTLDENVEEIRAKYAQQMNYEDILREQKAILA